MKTGILTTVLTLVLSLQIFAMSGPETSTNNAPLRSQIVRWFENIDLSGRQSMNESIDLSFVVNPDGKVHLLEVITANHTLQKLIEDTFNQLKLQGIFPPVPQEYRITVQYQVV